MKYQRLYLLVNQSKKKTATRNDADSLLQILVNDKVLENVDETKIFGLSDIFIMSKLFSLIQP